MRNLRDKVAVVTGAGSGIGRSLALRLAQEGCALALCDLDSEALYETRELLKEAGLNVFTSRIDVSDRVMMEQFTEQTISHFGKIHLLINNVGVALSASVEETSIENFEWIMNINFWGVVYGTKFFLPYLKQEEEAHIVNMSSMFGLLAPPFQSAYSATKFAVRAFSESLRNELIGTSVHISCVHPGFVKTSIAESGKFISGLGVQSRNEFLNQFDKLTSVTPSKAADVIVAGIKKNKDRILIGWEPKVYDLLQRIFPVKHKFVYKLYS